MPRPVLFLGSKRVGLRCLAAIEEVLTEDLAGAVTIDDRADSRTAFNAIVALCTSLGIPLTIAGAPQDAATAIQRHAPLLCIVCGWYWRIESAVLASVPLGLIGVHFSALPRYRGGSPLVWQIINGEPEAGVSLFSLTDGLDEGPVWAQARVPVGETDYVGEVLVHLEDATVGLVKENVPLILDGRIRPTNQDSSAATVVPMRRPSDGKIDWQSPARVVYNFVRAQSSPYPGAYTFVDGKKLTVWRVLLTEATCDGTPGQVVRVTPDGVWVVCSDYRALILQRVGLNGMELSAPDVITSPGVRLGSPPQ
jgi:methionyl-tRNA formyltransferase